MSQFEVSSVVLILFLTIFYFILMDMIILKYFTIKVTQSLLIQKRVENARKNHPAVIYDQILRNISIKKKK